MGFARGTLAFLAGVWVLAGWGQARAAGGGFEHPGGMHTADEIRWVRENLGSEPWKGAFAQLLAEADAALGARSRAVEDLDVPFYYGSPDASMAAKQGLSDDASAAYALALAYQLDGSASRFAYADKAAELLTSWGKTHRRVSGYDGDLVMCYAGIPFVFAADLLSDYEGWAEGDREAFRGWVRNVFLASAARKKQEKNNQGDWGTFASAAGHHLLDDGEGMLSDTELLKGRIAGEIALGGELPAENKRTNSGMWYTYFALAPMTGSVNVVRNGTGVDLFQYEAPNGRTIREALGAFFVYCQHPETWPYKRKAGIAGLIQGLAHPSAEEVKLPSPGSWPGNLYEAMAIVYDEPAWAEYVKDHRPVRGGRGWIYPTLMCVPAR